MERIVFILSLLSLQLLGCSAFSVLSSGCSCNDGGTHCRAEDWCYVEEGACSDNTPYEGKYWSYEACKTSGCSCNDGGGCEADWCYVNKGACSDNTPYLGKYWSYEACKTSKPQTPASDTSGFTQFAKEGLEAHNKRRTVPLELDAALCKDAQAYADNLAYYDIFEHADQKDQGENLSYWWGQNKDAEAVVKGWYDEKITGKHCMGHYTQVVWKESKKFCMAKSESASKKIYSVARYYPAGNFGFQDDYERNVEWGFVCPCCG